jgi:hypothetical protein
MGLPNRRVANVGNAQSGQRFSDFGLILWSAHGILGHARGDAAQLVQIPK